MLGYEQASEYKEEVCGYYSHLSATAATGKHVYTFCLNFPLRMHAFKRKGHEKQFHSKESVKDVDKIEEASAALSQATPSVEKATLALRSCLKAGKSD